MLIFILGLFLFSCASQEKKSGGVDSSTSVAQEQGLEKYSGGYKLAKDEETGFTRAVSDKTSPFGGETNPFSGENGAEKKEFATANYDSRRWNGTKSKSTKEWNQADKSYEYSPEFIRKNSHYADNYARESNSTYNQSGNSYQTASANEQSGDRLSRDLDYQVEKRREVYIPPKIMDKYEQQSGRSVDDVKALLND